MNVYVYGRCRSACDLVHKYLFNTNLKYFSEVSNQKNFIQGIEMIWIDLRLEHENLNAGIDGYRCRRIIEVFRELIHKFSCIDHNPKLEMLGESTV